MNNKRWRWGKIPHRLRSQALSLFDASRERMIWGLRQGCLIGPNPLPPRASRPEQVERVRIGIGPVVKRTRGLR